MASTKHYHVLSGDHGYMPDMNSVYRTRRQALAGLAWWADSVSSSCEPDYAEHKGKCYSGNIYKDGYVSFKDGHGTEYSEVTTCYEEECLEEID